jgi:hypothetical protein
MRRAWVRLAPAVIDGLPFRFNRARVAERLLQARHPMSEASPRHLQPQDQQDALVASKRDPLNARFLPFHSADVRGLQSSVVGQYGIDRVEIYWVWQSTGKNGAGMLVPRTRTVTDWSVGGTLIIALASA